MTGATKKDETPKLYQTLLGGELTMAQYREVYPEVVEAVRRGSYLSASITVTRPLGGHDATVHLMTSAERHLINKIAATKNYEQYLPLSAICLDTIGDISSPLLTRDNQPKSGSDEDIAEWLKRSVVAAWFDTVGRLPDAFHITLAILHNDLQFLYVLEMEESIRLPFVTKS